MTRQSRHIRTVVMGQPVCTCGSDWVCVNSPEGRWDALREYLDSQVAELNAEIPTETVLMQRNLRHHVKILTGVTDRMDELEGEAMKALSIREPWLHAILHSDKRVENRSWPAPASVIGTVIALHASKRFDWDAEYPEGRKAGWCAPEDLALGAICGVARIAGCHPVYNICNPAGPVTVCTPWSIWGQAHWLLADIRPLPAPVPCKGALGLWTLPDDAERAVTAQLELEAT